MSTEPSPELRESITLAQNFLTPLEDSQITLASSNWDHDPLVSLDDCQNTHNLTPNWQCEASRCEASVTVSQPPSNAGHFLSRPVFESPFDLQNGFRYSKAPTSHRLSSRQGPPWGGLGIKANVEGGCLVKTSSAPSSTDSQTMGVVSTASMDSHRVEVQDGEERSKENMERDHQDSISSDPHSDTIPTTREQSRGVNPSCSALHPPFQKSSPSNDVSVPLQQTSRARISSPATKSSRLPKGFADIQRKALIQSNHTNRSSPSVHRQKTQAIKDPIRSDPPEKRQISAQLQAASHTRRGLHQAQAPGNVTPNRSPDNHRVRAPIRSQPNCRSVSGPMKCIPVQQRSDYNSPRPVSQASNISKARAPLENTQADPRREQENIEIESCTTRNDLVGAWNRHFIHEARRISHWKEKMESMVEQLAERDKRVAEYLEQIQIQEQIIGDLEIGKQNDLATCQEQEIAIAQLNEQRQKLRERMKEYKKRLNDVTNEQQSIFKYFQPRYHEMREQMKQAEIKHQEALKQALSASEQVKDKIQKGVKEVKILSEQEIQNLRSEIRILELKLEEREKDVDRERAHVSDLRRELDESHERNRSSFESLIMQNQVLMEKSDSRSVQVQNIEQCVQNQEHCIGSLQKLMEDDMAVRQTPSELMKSLETLQGDAVNGILLELHERAERDREWSSKGTEALKKDILGVREFCTRLSEQIQSSLDATDWQERVQKAQMDHQAALWEASRLREKLANMHDEAKTQREQQEILQRELDSLSASVKVTDAAKEEINALQNDKQRFQQCLVEKESLICTLENDLREATATLSTQECQLKDQERKLQNEKGRLTDAIANCHDEQYKAVKQAKEECKQTQAKYHDVENLLRNAVQKCNRLQEEVVQAKQRGEHAIKNSEAEAARQAQELLIPIADQIEKISAALQNSQQADDNLNARLKAWSKGQVDVSLLEQAIQKLAKDCETNIANGKLLEGFLDVQKKLDNTWQWHISEVDALNRTTELEKSVKADTLRSLLLGHKENHGISRVKHRRVMIHSPDIEHDRNQRMTPLSIEEERVTRRQAVPLKGIMKPAALQVEGQHYQETLATKQSGRSLSRQAISADEKSTLVSHSAYNRPVSGSASSLEGHYADSMPEKVETPFAEILSTKKRKLAETEGDERQNVVKKPSQPGRRVKISDSMSTDPRNAEPKEPTMNAMH